MIIRSTKSLVPVVGKKKILGNFEESMEVSLPSFASILFMFVCLNHCNHCFLLSFVYFPPLEGRLTSILFSQSQCFVSLPSMGGK